jgi:hypothetical protein
MPVWLTQDGNGWIIQSMKVDPANENVCFAPPAFAQEEPEPIYFRRSAALDPAQKQDHASTCIPDGLETKNRKINNGPLHWLLITLCPTVLGTKPSVGMVPEHPHGTTSEHFWPWLLMDR